MSAETKGGVAVQLPAKAQASRVMPSFMQLLLDRLVSVLCLLVALGAVGWGTYGLVQAPGKDVYSIPALVGLCVGFQVLFLDAYRQHRVWDFKVAGLSLLSFVLMLVLRGLPPHITGLQLNAVFDRSLFASAFLLAVGIPGLTSAIFYLFGATPHGEDMARYPLLLIPVLSVTALYVLLMAQLWDKGWVNMKWEYLTQPFYDNFTLVRKIIQDWPVWTTVPQQQDGLLFQIQGTGLLMLLTSAISLPIGAGAGIFLAEYGRGRLADLSRFAINSLRAMSLLILGLTAISLVEYTTGTPLAAFVHGTSSSLVFGEQIVDGGSFLTASLILSLLIVPMITRAAEEGCRALPPELREGSLALGATAETTLWRVVLPWALPNILTAVLLGCAEVSGSVAAIMFIAGKGEDGAGPFRQVTSLAYVIFAARDETAVLLGKFRPFVFTAALLLIGITLSLGLVGILLKRLLVWRYRGGTNG